MKEQFGDERRSEIVTEREDISIEDLIAPQDMVVTLSHAGYVKCAAARRVPRAEARRPRQAGDDDEGRRLRRAAVRRATRTTTSCASPTAAASTGSRCTRCRRAARIARGKPIVNLFPLQEGEKITAVLPVKEFDEDHFVFMATAQGTVKKTPLAEFSRPRPSGIIAVDLDEGDYLVGVALTDGKHDVMLFSDGGKAVRFDEDDVRPMGRKARGVRGMTLDEGQQRDRACWSPRTRRRACSPPPRTATASARRSPSTRATAAAARA